ncbi:ATP-binding protein [Actinomadura fulvescens]|uniref:ATP-binding protein n=1 Tax=Actinomadura fulvescens TaxID=46160 RepID=UPI0031D767CE
MSSFASLVVPARSESVKNARDWVAVILADWGHDPYVGKLVVSELVTNASKHTASVNMTVRVGRAEAWPVIEILDSSTEMPVARPLNESAEGGRGLAMLAALVKDWGAQPLETGGKAVWAILHTPTG